MNITRIKKTSGKKLNFEYFTNGNKIIDKHILERIQKLCIPPNWDNVKISTSETDYLQAIGKDDKGRTQYIYHPMWVELSKIEKYSRLAKFERKLPLLIKNINQQLSGPVKTNDREYLIALVFRILLKTHARIGNECYADENNTYGLTTLLKKHMIISNSGEIRFSFVGKKGVEQNLSFRDSVSLKALREFKKIRGDRLFQTEDQQPLKAVEMNDYLKEKMGDDFTCKDFRTYGSNILFLKILCKQEAPTSMSASKRILNKVYDEVAEQLGHTRAISKKSYVMPMIGERFLENPSEFLGKDPKKLMKDMLKDF